MKYLFCQVVFCFFPSILCYFSLLHTRFSWFLKLFFISNLPPVLLSTGNLTSSSSRFNNHLFYLLSSTVSGTHPPEILPIWWQTTDKYSEFHFHLSAPIVLLSSFKTLLLVVLTQRWPTWSEVLLHPAKPTVLWWSYTKCCSGRDDTREWWYKGVTPRSSGDGEYKGKSHCLKNFNGNNTDAPFPCPLPHCQPLLVVHTLLGIVSVGLSSCQCLNL